MGGLGDRLGRKEGGRCEGTVNLVLRLRWGMAGGGGAFGGLTEVKRYWWLLKKPP